MNNFKKLRARWTRRLFLAVSLALGLVLGSGVAYGYWNVTGQRNLVGATLTSGTFDLTVGPSGGLAGTSNAYTLTMSDVSNLFPGESVAQSIVVNNASTGDAFMDITLSNFTVGSTSFGSYLTVTAYPFGSAPANTSGAVESGNKPAVQRPRSGQLIHLLQLRLLLAGPPRFACSSAWQLERHHRLVEPAQRCRFRSPFLRGRRRSKVKDLMSDETF